MQRADRVEALRALLKNTTPRASVALLLVIFCACLLSACGSSSDSAQSLLGETFSGHTQIESGNVNLSFALCTSGSSSSTKPLAVSLNGPFQSVGDGKLMDSGKRAALQVKEGDRVLFSSYAGNEVTVDGEEYLIMSEDDVLAVVD